MLRNIITTKKYMIQKCIQNVEYLLQNILKNKLEYNF